MYLGLETPAGTPPNARVHDTHKLTNRLILTERKPVNNDPQIRVELLERGSGYDAILGVSILFIRPPFLRLTCIRRRVHVLSCSQGGIPGGARMRLCEDQEVYPHNLGPHIKVPSDSALAHNGSQNAFSL